MVYRGYHCLRCLVLDLEQRHLFSSPTPGLPGIFRVSFQDQLDNYFIYGNCNDRASVSWRRGGHRGPAASICDYPEFICRGQYRYRSGQVIYHTSMPSDAAGFGNLWHAGLSDSGSNLISSGTISVAYGVVTDVASPAERGSYVSAISFA